MDARFDLEQVEGRLGEASPNLPAPMRVDQPMSVDLPTLDVPESWKSHLHDDDLIFSSRYTDAEKASRLAIFDSETGLAVTATAHAVSVERLTQALRLADRLLPHVIHGGKKRYGIRLLGVGGSFHDGEPRIGLFPPGMTYQDAKSIESQKRYERGALLLGAPDRIVPSDIDLFALTEEYIRPRPKWIEPIASLLGKGKKMLQKIGLVYDPEDPTLGRAITKSEKEIMQAAPQVLEQIFEETGVYISITFLKPDHSRSCSQIKEVLDKLNRLEHRSDNPNRGYRMMEGVNYISSSSE